MNAKLIRPDGLYTDGLSGAAGNPQIDNTAEHAQTYPLYYGIAPAANQAKLLDKITSQGMKQGPMTWHVLLKALADGGRYDQVVKLLTDQNADGPARTLDQQGTYMWEQWNPGCGHDVAVQPDQQRVDVARLGRVGHRRHGRVAARRAGHGPGASTVKIEPPAVDDADLHRVSGSAWTQRGTVAVTWKKATAPTCSTSTCPPTQKATVAIPNPDGSSTSAWAPARRSSSADGRPHDVHRRLGRDALQHRRRGAGGVGGTVPADALATLGAPASSARSRRASRRSTRRPPRPTSPAPRVTRR